MSGTRIPIPSAKDPLGVLKLTAAVGKGITSKGSGSLITGELSAELLAVAAKIPEAIEAHEEAEELRRRAEKLYEKRNAIVAESLPLVQRGSKALQGNLGKARLREMGEYGYTVNSSVKTPKPPKA